MMQAVTEAAPLARRALKLQGTTYTLHPTRYTPHPTPYTLHPTLYTLHPLHPPSSCVNQLLRYFWVVRIRARTHTHTHKPLIGATISTQPLSRIAARQIIRLRCRAIQTLHFLGILWLLFARLCRAIESASLSPESNSLGPTSSSLGPILNPKPYTLNPNP